VTTSTGPSRRPVGPDDLDEVAALLAACDIAVVGFADFTADEVLADLRRSDREPVGWYDDGGTLVAYGWVSQAAGSNQCEADLYVHPDHDPALGPEVLAHLEDRARLLVEHAGYDEPVIGIGVYRQDARTRAWVEAAGYHRGTTFTRMRIALDHPTPAPSASVTIHEIRPDDEAGLRVAHEIAEESFVEHFAHAPMTFDAWRSQLTRYGEDWSKVWLAEVDGQPVGVMVTTNQFVETDDAGYVRTLGTRTSARGKGVGTALLLHHFARAAADGRTAAILHVDVSNVTGALRLYESVGMRRVLEIDAWIKGELSTVDADAPS
jgi:ribosomal protein S18 acetylase RimI-like enzyme